MKALTCEMCGSTDLIKDGGVFVCQSCGTKYTVEEAKKMMVEGTVSVKGTVTVDNSGSIANYLTMAENAYAAGNKEEAEKYCNKIIEINPNHVKAWMLKGKAAGWQSTLAKIRIDETVQCFVNAINNASSTEIEEIKKEAIDEIINLSTTLVHVAGNHYSEFPGADGADTFTDTILLSEKYLDNLFTMCDYDASIFKESIATTINNSVCEAYSDKILPEYKDDEHPSKFEWETFKERSFSAISLLKMAIDFSDKDDQADIERYKSLIIITNNLIDSCSWTYSNGGWTQEWSLSDEAKKLNIDNIMEYHNKIKEIDPNYVIPERRSTKPESSGGCYVATAVYGSYDCPEVWTLRRFRDNTLDSTWYGRLFIQTYYTISPSLVKWFGNTSWFKQFWRGKLDKMVANLKAKGVESTPYKDKY